MKNDGLVFLLVVIAIIGFAKILWSYINLYYEVLELRKKLGREKMPEKKYVNGKFYFIKYLRFIFSAKYYENTHMFKYFPRGKKAVMIAADKVKTFFESDGYNAA